MPLPEPTYSNAYRSEQVWAQARHRGREKLEILSPLLKTSRFGRDLVAFETIDSTNRVASSWAADGAPDGAVVLAEYQEQGRGRFRRTWLAAPGKNLMFTLVLRPRFDPHLLHLVMLSCSVAVADSIGECTGFLDPDIKWPNDVLLNERKCCGMLMETSFTGGNPAGTSGAVLGVGLNVNQTDFPPEISPSATSVALESGRHVDRMVLLANILNRLERFIDEIPHDNGASIRGRFVQRMEGLGRTVDVYTGEDGDRLRGVISGISEQGALLLDTESGRHELLAGDVSFREDLS